MMSKLTPVAESNSLDLNPANQIPAAVVRVKKLHGDAKIPFRGSAQAAGFDVFAYLSGAIELHPGKRTLVASGISIALPEGYEAQVRPRSGLAFKHGVTVLNSPGTIDADYRGEVNVILINHGEEMFTINHGERIAQLVIAKVADVAFCEVEELDATERNTSGFGSTGLK